MIDFMTGEHYSSLADYTTRKLPDYYPTMYRDGYTAQEVYAAFHKTIRKKYEQERQRKAMQEQIAAADDGDNYSVKLSSEVKVK